MLVLHNSGLTRRDIRAMFGRSCGQMVNVVVDFAPRPKLWLGFGFGFGRNLNG
jgi:hypothetical protein